MVKEGVNGKKTISLLTHGLILSKERPRECNERATAATTASPRSPFVIKPFVLGTSEVSVSVECETRKPSSAVLSFTDYRIAFAYRSSTDYSTLTCVLPLPCSLTSTLSSYPNPKRGIEAPKAKLSCSCSLDSSALDRRKESDLRFWLTR